MADTFITEGQAFGITYGALGLFAAVAMAAGIFVYKGMAEKGADYWYSARGSQGFFSLGLSFFASSMGAWVIFAAPETGANFGWWGTLGYALASTIPFGVMASLGPLVRSRYPQGFCLTDWVLERFGRPTQTYVAIISVFYMWIYLVAELTSMGGLIQRFAGLDPLSAVVPVALVTMLYTMAAGLPASIWTDRAQGIIMTVFVLIAVIACSTDVSFTSEAWSSAASWSDQGFEALVTLILAIIGAELFNMSSWQRVYASQNNTQLRLGLLLGGSLIFPTMVLFGVLGMLAEAQDQSRPTSTMVIKAFAFYDLLGGQSTFIKCVAFALSVCMVASSVDSLQTGLVSVVSQDIAARKLKPVMATGMGQLFVLLANIPAIALAAEATKDPTIGFNVLNLFLIADLLTLSMAMPVFMGLGSLATQTGTLAGCASGLVTIFAFGWVEFGTFVAGLEMVTLMSFGNTAPPQVGLFASRTAILFFVLPIVTAAVTFFVSAVERVVESLPKQLEDAKRAKAESKEAI
mmetsp:Transcript_21400/g.47426  ORF Transcript_21400/g.47426 Transcript_21400/m.47426 type:complete len:519 (+) Transcript_21400:154-1710(+)|eukprot:CAMPEP_0170600802 /NCGR_PEP_ID=MMETSP0224-20130122/17524_1 /TAXON_ID=285029 /ORGANISM="Togula jolla, Strain CCCM 725" /LENGTH=518 /DNA_ID=CAMNT_0010925543 /DNA_START=62 /DNA_END=1618 /DNA_ORIENTATION=+